MRGNGLFDLLQQIAHPARLIEPRNSAKMQVATGPITTAMTPHRRHSAGAAAMCLHLGFFSGSPWVSTAVPASANGADKSRGRSHRDRRRGVPVRTRRTRRPSAETQFVARSSRPPFTIGPAKILNKDWHCFLRYPLRRRICPGKWRMRKTPFRTLSDPGFCSRQYREAGCPMLSGLRLLRSLLFT